MVRGAIRLRNSGLLALAAAGVGSRGERAGGAFPLGVEEDLSFQVSGAGGGREGAGWGSDRAGRGVEGVVADASKLSMKQLPALLRCLCDAPHWRSKMRAWLPMLLPESALYTLLHHQAEFLKLPAQEEATRCLTNLSRRHESYRRWLISRGAVAKVCGILKTHQGPRAGAVRLLQALVNQSPGKVLSWVQAGSPYARVELWILELLDLVRAARQETILAAAPPGSTAADAPADAAHAEFRASFGVNPSEAEGEAVLCALLQVLSDVAVHLKAQGWRAVIDRGGTELLADLLHGPPLSAPSSHLLCLILSSFSMYAKARRRLRGAGGLAGLVHMMHGGGGDAAALGCACSAAQAVRIYLAASDEFAFDCQGPAFVSAPFAWLALAAAVGRQAGRQAGRRERGLT